MYKWILALVVLGAIIVSGYYSTREDTSLLDGLPTSEAQHATFADKEWGISFPYRIGPTGYVLQKNAFIDAAVGKEGEILLIQVKDKAEGVFEASEGPITMFVLVFANTKKLSAHAWADAHTQQSNMHLRLDDISEVVVGGTTGIRYMTDGLYPIDTIVVAHGDKVYVIGGPYLDEVPALRRDFVSLVETIQFIPAADQR